MSRDVFWSVYGWLSPTVRERIDEERDVMVDDQAQHAGEHQRAPHVAGQHTDQQRQCDVHGQHQRDVVSVLEHHDRIALEVFHVFEVGHAARVFAQHPADVREPHAAAGRVGVEVFVVDEAVMRAMAGRPYIDAVLNGHRAEQHEEDAHRPMCLVGVMRPEPVIAGGDRQARRDQKDAEPHPRGRRVADEPAVQRYADHSGHERGREQDRRHPVDGGVRRGVRHRVSISVGQRGQSNGAVVRVTCITGQKRAEGWRACDRSHLTRVERIPDRGSRRRARRRA